MHALVSLLPSPFYEEVLRLWQMLDTEFGLRGVQVTPHPHFSWQIAQDYDFPLLEASLAEIAAQTRPFPARAAGLGLFTGPRPVVYIPVVKDAALMDFHARLWKLAEPVCRGASPYYSPTAWQPHISLAYEDVAPTNVAAVLSALAFRPFNWEMLVDNLAVIYEPTGAVGQIHFKALFDETAEGDSV